MARSLIIGCGCRGRLLARALRGTGLLVRGTTRDPSRRAQIEAVGAEPFVADPDRVATLLPALDQVSVACVLLGSAVGSAADLAALHGTRLETLVNRMVDSTVRGIVFEAAGSVERTLLHGGGTIVRATCERSRIPYVLLEADPSEPDAWLMAAVRAVDRVLASHG